MTSSVTWDGDGGWQTGLRPLQCVPPVIQSADCRATRHHGATIKSSSAQGQHRAEHCQSLPPPSHTQARFVPQFAWLLRSVVNGLFGLSVCVCVCPTTVCVCVCVCGGGTVP